ncbi:hypothetical protein [Cohnella caldifontis]|uniref:hypothetical protein n=1 Tax=Cohnella caldifontis TaxID=3027471 RepID=UPI0023EBBC29|nr:hypothetical protein [Cohnella sp. YIM B05605]
MKTFLVISQFLYALCIIPWLLIWGISFMSFDQGFSWFGVALVTGVGIYPIAAVISSILAWILRKRRKRLAILFNFIPLLWILGLGIPFVYINMA